ncbi:MAG: radical SAM peptide maturase, partial [Bacteroidales bacterium]
CGYGELYNDYDERVGNDLSFEKAVAIIDYLSSYWQSSNNQSGRFNVYISFYGGEPLLNMCFVKKVIDYIEQINSYNRYFTFSMTTNAVLLDKYIDYLVEKDFNLLISLDGDKSNNQYRVNKANQSTVVRDLHSRTSLL